MLGRTLSLTTAAALLLGGCNQTQSQPQQPSTYSVLFDTDSSTLSNQATSTIQQVAATYPAGRRHL